MEIRSDKSMSGKYFEACLRNKMKEPKRSSIFKKDTDHYILDDGVVLICCSNHLSLLWLQKELDQCYEWLGGIRFK